MKLNIKTISIFLCIIAICLCLSMSNLNNYTDTVVHNVVENQIMLKSNKLPKKYKLTHYGWDCKGCGGKTATGYNIRKTIWYNDKQYGKVRIVAMCKKMPLYSIIKIKNYKRGGDITAIVLDRGVGCSTIDLAVKNERTSSKYGIQKNVKIEVLRRGK